MSLCPLSARAGTTAARGKAAQFKRARAAGGAPLPSALPPVLSCVLSDGSVCFHFQVKMSQQPLPGPARPAALLQALVSLLLLSGRQGILVIARRGQGGPRGPLAAPAALARGARERGTHLQSSVMDDPAARSPGLPARGLPYQRCLFLHLPPASLVKPKKYSGPGNVAEVSPALAKTTRPGPVAGRDSVLAARRRRGTGGGWSWRAAATASALRRLPPGTTRTAGSAQRAQRAQQRRGGVAFREQPEHDILPARHRATGVLEGVLMALSSSGPLAGLGSSLAWPEQAECRCADVDMFSPS